MTILPRLDQSANQHVVASGTQDYEGDSVTHRLVVLGIYIFISLAYFSRPLLRGILIAHGDGFAYYYPLRAYYHEIIRSGFSDWNTYNFLGYSLVGTMQSAVFYPLNLIYLFLSAPMAFNLSIVLHYALAAFFMYLFCRTRVNSTYAAVIGGASFAFAGFLMAHRGHVAMMNAGIWLPLIFYYFERFRQSSKVRYIFFQALAIAAQILAGYFAVVVYTCILLGLYALLSVMLLSDRPQRDARHILWQTGSVLLAMGLALLLVAPQLYSTFITYRAAWRSGFDYYFYASGSFPPFMLLSFVFPFLFGGGFGAPIMEPWNVVGLSGYLGALPLITAIVVVISRFRKSGEVKLWSLIALFVFGAIFNRFTPLGKILYWLPVYNIFRYQSRFIIGLDFALAVLFCYGIDAFLLKPESLLAEYPKYVAICSGLIAVGLSLSTIGSSVFQHHIFDEPGLLSYVNASGLELLEKLFSLSSPTLWIPLMFLAGLIVLTRALSRQHLTGLLAALAVLLFLLLEQFSFGMFYDTNWPKRSLVRAAAVNPAIQFIHQHLSKERYLAVGLVQYLPGSGVPGGLFNLDDHVASVNGTEPLFSNDAHEMFGFFPDGTPHNTEQLLAENLVLSTAAVKYVLIPKTDLNPEIRAITQRKLPYDVVDSGQIASARLPISSWQYFDSYPLSRDEYALRPHKELPYGIGGMLMAPLAIERNRRYLVRFEAKIDDRPPSTFPGVLATLVADFYAAPSYDPASAEVDLYSVDLTSEYRPFTAVFDSGPSAPPIVQFRVYTGGGDTIMVRNIEIAKIDTQRIPVSEAAAASIDDNGGAVYRTVFQTDDAIVVENLNARPRLFCVNQLVGMRDREQMLPALASWQINPATQALVEPAALARIRGALSDGPMGCGPMSVRDFQSGLVDVAVDFERPGFLVFSEEWDPRWHAYVDGVEHEVFRTDYFAQGVAVPAGAKAVRLIYQPWKNNYSVLGPILFVALWAGWYLRGRSWRLNLINHG
jgi:hypothetical protein